MKCLGYSIEIAENSDIQIMKILIYISAKSRKITHTDYENIDIYYCKSRKFPLSGTNYEVFYTDHCKSAKFTTFSFISWYLYIFIDN
jgi:hypothetical protein